MKMRSWRIVRALLVGMMLGATARAAQEMQLVIHCGMLDKTVPPNTVEAIKRAYDAGATWVEADCHHTKAGQMICLHTEEVLKALTGCTRKIRDLTPAEVAGLDLGVHFPSKKTYRIPLLSQVLAVVPKTAVFQAEIKGYSPTYADEFDRGVKAAGLSETNIVVSSFRYDALKDFKARYPKYRTMWLVDLKRPVGGQKFPIKKYVDQCRAANIALFCPRCASTPDVLTPADADILRAAGVEVRVYGVNSPEELRQAKALRATGFTTDSWQTISMWADEVGDVSLRK